MIFTMIISTRMIFTMMIKQEPQPQVITIPLPKDASGNDVYPDCNRCFGHSTHENGGDPDESDD